MVLIRRAAILVCIAWLTSAGPASGGLRISLISRSGSPMNQTGDVECLRFATLESESRVFQDMPVFPFDELRCRKDGIELELSDSTRTLRLSGPFRAILRPDRGDTLVIELMSGDADMRAQGPSEICAGLIVAGSRKTLYGVRLQEQGGQLQQSCLVFDGEVVCAFGAEVVVLEPGQRVSSAGEKWTRAELQEEDITQTADRFARMDAAIARLRGVEGRELSQTQTVLRDQYVAVLRNPTSAEARSALAITQIKYRLPTGALYEVANAEKQLHPTATQQRAVLMAVRSEAFAQMGRFDEARIVREQSPARLPADLKGSGGIVVKLTNLETVEDPYEQLFALIQAKRYKEAIVGFAGRIKSGVGGARDYYGLALAQSKEGARKAASINAAYALRLDAKQQALLPEERSGAEKLAKNLDPKTKAQVIRMQIPKKFQ